MTDKSEEFWTKKERESKEKPGDRDTPRGNPDLFVRIPSSLIGSR